MHTPRCFNNHMGLYAIDGRWFSEAVAAIRSGLWPIRSQADIEQAMRNQTMQVFDGLAVIPIHGSMMKGFSKFGGASTVEARKQIRAAVADRSIRGIMLHVDSPGGAVAGTKELADDIFAARGAKPIHAFIEDMGASAAYWVSSQAEIVTANATALIGSIGTVAVVHDASGAAEMQGVKVHVISTGEMKGAGVLGTELSEAYLEEIQRTVDALNEHFLLAIGEGRGITSETVRTLADGRVHIANEAAKLGLIDSVSTFQAALEKLSDASPVEKQPAPGRRRAAAVAARLAIAKLKS